MNEPNFIPTEDFMDQRGLFMKHNLQVIGVDFSLRDYFVTKSNSGVLRGLHWQSDFCATNRIVTSITGEIFDVTVDMREDSADFGKPKIWELSQDSPGFLYIPKGFAHGYQVLSGESIIAYMTDGKHCAEHDTGILWSSLGINWPLDNPIVSERDSSFPKLQDITFRPKKS